MQRARQTFLVFLGLLFSNGGVADDSVVDSTDVKLSSVVAFYVKALRSESEHNSRWSPLYSIETMTAAEAPAPAIVNLNFEDAGTFARVGKIRSLSLLTIAEAKGTRLFLGVNRKGLFGLHLRAVPPDGSDRYLEVARMPYLAKGQPPNVAR